jgi:hypothetical protein
MATNRNLLVIALPAAALKPAVHASEVGQAEHGQSLLVLFAAIELLGQVCRQIFLRSFSGWVADHLTVDGKRSLKRDRNHCMFLHCAN